MSSIYRALVRTRNERERGRALTHRDRRKDMQPNYNVDKEQPNRPGIDSIGALEQQSSWWMYESNINNRRIP